MKKSILFLLSIVMISCANNKTQDNSSTALNIMTFNIRYDNPDDSLNNWQYRKERVKNAILFYDVDILGAQEVLHNQMMDLKSMFPSYEYIGVGREDGKQKGEYSPLFYKKDRFETIDTGYFWLSETPDVAGSKGWDGACERIATWAKLSDLRTGKKFIVINTHFDHVGKVARRESVNLISTKIKELADELPVILMGDFNSTPESDVITKILDKENAIQLNDSRSVSPLTYGPSWSFHDFGKIPYEERPLIDYVFVNENIKVKKHAVLAEQDGEEFLSDHTPVFVNIEIN